MRYANLAELRDAYAAGKVTNPLMLDNDCASIWPEEDDATEVLYSAHPELILEEALHLLGIPTEHV